MQFFKTLAPPKPSTSESPIKENEIKESNEGSTPESSAPTSPENNEAATPDSSSVVSSSRSPSSRRDSVEDSDIEEEFMDDDENVTRTHQKLANYVRSHSQSGTENEIVADEYGEDEIDSLEKFMEVFATSIHNDGYPFLKQTRKGSFNRRLLKMDDTRTVLSWSSNKMKKNKKSSMFVIADIVNIEVGKRWMGILPHDEEEKMRCVMIVDKNGKHLDTQFTSVQDAEVFVAGMTQLVKNLTPPLNSNPEPLTVPAEPASLKPLVPAEPATEKRVEEKIEQASEDMAGEPPEEYQRPSLQDAHAVSMKLPQQQTKQTTRRGSL